MRILKYFLQGVLAILIYEIFPLEEFKTVDFENPPPKGCTKSGQLTPKLPATTL